MPAFLPNTTTTAKYTDTILGGESSPYDHGQLLIANNPVSMLVLRGIDRASLSRDEYPYVTPAIVPLLGSTSEQIFGVQIKSAITGQAAQVSGYLIERNVAGLGPGTAFTQQVAASGTVAVSVLPSGTILFYGGSTAPTGYVLCDGSLYDGTQALYASLWAAIGTTFGGTGQNSFAVPDLRGRVPVGFAAGGNVAVATLGLNDGVALANRRPKHRHTPHTHTINADPVNAGTAGQQVVNTTNNTRTVTTAAVDGGSGVATDSLDAPAYMVVNHIIAL